MPNQEILLIVRLKNRKNHCRGGLRINKDGGYALRRRWDLTTCEYIDEYVFYFYLEY